MDELISIKKAREVYGVAVSWEGIEYSLDLEETKKLRQELSKKPPRTGYGPGECNPHGAEIEVVQ